MKFSEVHEVIAKIQEALQDAEKEGRPTSYASWNAQEGILLTLDEAKALIDAISTK